MGLRLPRLPWTPFDEGARRTAQDLADLRYAPLGLYELGRALALDYTDPVRAWNEERLEAERRGGEVPGFPSPFDIRWSRTRRLLRDTGEGLVESLRHPGRHPGDTALILAGLLTGGAATGARGATALRSVRGAQAVRKTPRPRIAVAPRSFYRELDPGNLGVRKLARELDMHERIATSPARAVTRNLRPTRRERLIAIGEGSVAKARRSAARERELRELRARQAEAAAAARRLSDAHERRLAPVERRRLTESRVVAGGPLARHARAQKERKQRRSRLRGYGGR